MKEVIGTASFTRFKEKRAIEEILMADVKGIIGSLSFKI